MMKLSKDCGRSENVRLDLFNVAHLSPRKRNQLLKPLRMSASVDLRPDNAINIHKRQSDHLDSLAAQFTFSDDVVAQRCVHLLPYRDAFYDSVYKLPRPPTKKKPHKAFVARPGIPEAHRCHGSVNEMPSLSAAMTKRRQIVVGGPTQRDDATESASTVSVANKRQRHWDEYLLSLLSPGTAQYLAYDATADDSSQAVRLRRLVNGWYGPPPPFVELIPSEAHEYRDAPNATDLKAVFPYKYYMDRLKASHDTAHTAPPLEDAPISARGKIRILLERELTLHSENAQTDPYGDNTKASFYRLPVVVRRTQKLNRDTNIETTNKTIETLKEFKLPQTPPKSVNHRMGNKILKTDNQFQWEIFLDEGKSQKKLLNFPDDIICVDGKIYRKTLQPIWPNVISNDLPSEEQLNSGQRISNEAAKGHKRWTRLPSPLQEDLLIASNVPDYGHLDTGLSRKRARDNTSLNLLVDQWRKKWQLSQRYCDSTTDELLRDMFDLHPTIRMQAIVTCAKAASLIHQQKHAPTGTVQETIQSDSLPAVLIEALDILLDDNHFQVRKAASIALHSLERSSERSLEILRELLRSESNVDRWAAVQCLALSNKCDGEVISELVDQLMNSEDILVHEKASHLLAKISYHTKLAHGLLGERLNSISWRQRVIVCKTLPLLHESLNRDLLRKLIYIMWNDPHKQVRIAASQVLGKTGNGKAVHDELIVKLQSDSELVRADALEKIRILKVMTTRIMPAFLKCFHDEFVIVRKEICHACYRLKIQDQVCINNLLELARYDPLWKIKLYAIRALSTITIPNPDIRSCFLWALQFEPQTRLRLEALKAISASIELDKEILDAIKSRILVEKDKTILSVQRKILTKVNMNVNCDIETVAEIKSEVRRFTTDRNHIIDTILYNEAVEDYEFLKEKLVVSNKLCVEGDTEFEVSETESDKRGDESNPDEMDQDEIDIVENINRRKDIRKVIDAGNDNKSCDTEENVLDNKIEKEIIDEKYTSSNEFNGEDVGNIPMIHHDETFVEKFPSIEEKDEEEETEMPGNRDEKVGIIPLSSEDINKEALSVIIEDDDEGLIAEDHQEPSNLSERTIQDSQAIDETELNDQTEEASVTSDNIHSEDDLSNIKVLIQDVDGEEIKSCQDSETVEESKENNDFCKKVSFVIEDLKEENALGYSSSIEFQNPEDEELDAFIHTDDLEGSEISKERHQASDDLNKDVLCADDFVKVAVVPELVVDETLVEDSDNVRLPEILFYNNDPQKIINSAIKERIDIGREIVTPITCNYKLPKDLDDIKVLQQENSVMSISSLSTEYDTSIDRVEAAIDPDLLGQVYEAIQDDGLDFGPLVPLS